MLFKKNYKSNAVILRCFIFFLVCISFSIATISRADIIVISNTNFSADEISVKKVKKLWLGKTKKIKSVGRVYVVDQAQNNKITQHFYKDVINKKNIQIKAYWAKMKFIGKGFPPLIKSDDSAVIKWVLEKNNRIGYIDFKSKTSDLKILLKIVGSE